MRRSSSHHPLLMLDGSGCPRGVNTNMKPGDLYSFVDETAILYQRGLFKNDSRRGAEFSVPLEPEQVQNDIFLIVSVIPFMLKYFNSTPQQSYDIYVVSSKNIGWTWEKNGERHVKLL